VHAQNSLRMLYFIPEVTKIRRKRLTQHLSAGHDQPLSMTGGFLGHKKPFILALKCQKFSTSLKLVAESRSLSHG